MNFFDSTSEGSNDFSDVAVELEERSSLQGGGGWPTATRRQ